MEKSATEMASELSQGKDVTGDVEGRRMLILYGSETGNSQDIAEDLGRLAERLRYKTEVSAMNEVGLGILRRYPLVVFVTSTTGQGQFPTNALKFWTRLRSAKLSPTSLAGVRFSIFGLGDSAYVKFNFSARKLHRRLEQLGATEFFPRGEGDERSDAGIDGAYIDWSYSFREYLRSSHPLPPGVSEIPVDVWLPPKITLELAPSMEGTPCVSVGANAPLRNQDISHLKAAHFSHVDHPDVQHEERWLQEQRRYTGTAEMARLSQRTAEEYRPDKMDRFNILRDDPAKYRLVDQPVEGEDPPDDLLPIPDSTDVFDAVIMGNQRMTPLNHWQDVRRIILYVSPKQRKNRTIYPPHEPGQTVAICPKNFPKDVQKLIDLMEWNNVADKPFIHYSKREDGFIFEHAPKDCFPLKDTTLRQLLTHNYDITSIPKRSFFESIRFFAKDEAQRERLDDFANPLKSDEFYDYTSRPRRSILEVLHDFSSIKIPYQWAPTLFPIIRPREYSICNGGSSVKDMHSPDYTRLEILVALVKYKTVLRTTREGLCSRYIASLRPRTQIRMILPDRDGIGIEETERPVIAIATGTGIAPIRNLFMEMAMHSSPGPQLLIYGGRNRAADFYFAQDWDALGIDVLAAFSRDQDEKLYVQHIILREAKLICRLVEQGGIVCLCGTSGAMPQQVRRALADAFVFGGLEPDMRAANRRLSTVLLWEETW